MVNRDTHIIIIIIFAIINSVSLPLSVLLSAILHYISDFEYTLIDEDIQITLTICGISFQKCN